jgi:acetyl-CoA synthetase
MTKHRNQRRPDDYARLVQSFRWHIPRHFNVAQVCAQRWATDAHGNRPAIIEAGAGARALPFTYRELHEQSCQLANALDALGIEAGDRVAIVLPQCAETAVAHLATMRLGAISMPLSVLFGPEALTFRLRDAQARIAIVDKAHLESVREAASECPDLADLILIDPSAECASARQNDRMFEHDYQSLINRSSTHHSIKQTLADDPAVLIYTSGTTGSPKGALIPHRALIGNLTGFVASQDWFPWGGHHVDPGVGFEGHDRFWSPADWAWTGGLWDALLPTLYFGRTIIGSRERFSADNAFEWMIQHQVTNAFLFPTALKQMMKARPRLSSTEQSSLRLRALMSAGESLGEPVFNWCIETLGLQPNEMFGQTEANYVVGNSSKRWPAIAGHIGRPYPGHRVAIVDEDGHELPPGESGEIGVHRYDQHGHPNPVLFLGYWNNPGATQAKFRGDWWLTGDLAVLTDCGDLRYQGRTDDLFKSSGYRIGPGEIEHCLIGHPEVLNAAVVPKPDADRGAIVKAFVVLNAPDRFQTPEQLSTLTESLQGHVRNRLAPYEYPREIEFVKALPMTTTGKIQRRVLRLQEEERARFAAGN